MAETAEPEGEIPERKSRLPLIIGLVLMVLLGGGGFYAVYSGLLFAAPHGQSQEVETPEPLPAIAFVALDPIVVSLTGSSARHLRFSAQLEVPEAHKEEVELLRPRIMDVLNGYLRAVDVAELESPGSLIKIRAQMLRRVQIVTGEGRIRDLLIIEFVLN